MTDESLAQSAAMPVPARVQQAHAERLHAVVAAHLEAVWRFLRRLGLSHADADDAAQDVMMVLAQKLEAVVPGSEKSFLFGTALRVAMRMRQARARAGDADDDRLEAQEDPAPGPDALSDERRAREVLDELLQGLPMELRAVFVLAEVEEMTAAQIAVTLDLPAGTVASRLRRAREIFDERLHRLHARWRFAGGET